MRTFLRSGVMASPRSEYKIMLHGETIVCVFTLTRTSIFLHAILCCIDHCAKGFISSAKILSAEMYRLTSLIFEECATSHFLQTLFVFFPEDVQFRNNPFSLFCQNPYSNRTSTTPWNGDPCCKLKCLLKWQELLEIFQSSH